jgi:galactokinase
MLETDFASREFDQQLKKVSSKFKELFGNTVHMQMIKAPGRVNLIGEHTDYNDGYVLPVAIDRQIVIAAQPRPDRKVCIHSLDFDSTIEFSLDSIDHDKSDTWSNYPRGVAHVLQSDGYRLSGMDVVMTGNIPQGAGLSSSAALEVATAYAFQVLGGLDIAPVTLIKICQKAENTFVGVNCGIMDQFISRLGKANHALFIDCRTLEYLHVPLPSEGVRIVVSNTGVRRGLVDSKYNERRSQCEEGVAILREYMPNIKALRDVPSKDFFRYRSHFSLSYKLKLPLLRLQLCIHKTQV